MSNLVLKSVILATSLLLLQTSFGASQPLDKQEIQELKKFGNLAQGKGNLLTPARGAISPEAAAARSLVQQIVIDIAGPDLDEKKINYVINIYGNDTINAWVQQIDPSNSQSAEGRWLKNYPERIWPLRQAWGFQNNNNSIYEIGITTGLLRSLHTKDELAFILGHELTHLFEGHTNHSDNMKDRVAKWWSSQSHEVVADHLGIDRILGKYELDAALTVMYMLFPKYHTPEKPEEALNKITSTHHDEGVRISSLQFYIEYLRRFDPRASILKETPLPATAKLDVNGRQAPRVIHEGDPESREKFIEIVRSMVKGEYENSRILIRDDQFYDRQLPDLIGDPAHSFKSLLLAALDEIEGAKISKAEKINSFLKVMIFLGNRASPYYPDSWNENWFGEFDSLQMRRLMRFLVLNSSGNDPWTLKAFTSFINDLKPKALHYLQVPFLGNAKGQWIIERLIKASPSWRDFHAYQTSMQAYEREDKFHTYDLATFLKFLDPANFTFSTLTNEEKIRRKIKLLPVETENRSMPLIEDIRTKILAELHNYPNSESLLQARDTYGLPEFLHLWDPEDQKSAWVEARNKAAQTHSRILNKILVEDLIKGLQSLTSTNTRQEKFSAVNYSDALNRIDLSQLDSDEMSRLLSAYEKFIEYALVTRNFENDLVRISRNDIILCGRLLERHPTPHQQNQKIKILQFIIQFTNSHIELSNIPEKAQAIVRKALLDLNSNQRISLIENLTPEELQLRQRIDELVKEYKATSYADLRYQIQKRSNKEHSPEASAIKTEMIHWEHIPSIRKRFISNMLFLFDLWSIPHQTNLTEYKRYLRNIEIADYYNRFALLSEMGVMPNRTATRLFQMMLANISMTSSLAEGAQLYSKTVKAIGKGFVPSPDDQKTLRTFLQKQMNTAPLKTQIRWLKQPEIRQILGARFTGETLADSILKSQKGVDRGHVKRELDRLEKLIPIKDKWPEAYTALRDRLAEQINLQPHEADSVFAKSELSVTERAEKANSIVRGMSGLAAYTRAMPPHEQLEMIEFMMGRSNKMPKTLATQKLIENKIDVRAIMLMIKEELKYRSVLDRSMVVNSIFAGSNSIIQSDEGLKIVHEHILKSVNPQNREIAEVLLNALAAAEGRNKSLMLSYALAQKIDANTDNGQNDKSQEGLTEALVLRSLLDAYGVPGVKLAQYLAFTSEFKDFQGALEIYQDAAMPISYYDALLLLQKRLDASWDPGLYRVTKILGSGSVNIAIEYQNLETGKEEVISIARDQIEIKTKEDFRRFQLLITELTRTPELRTKFAFVSGLMDLIKRSVQLEFNKQNSFTMQQSVQSIYRREIDGWNLQSVDAFEVMGMGIRMEKAPGVGARKVLKSDPDAYRSAMHAFMKVEYEVLRGVDESKNWIPLPMYANPDIHDGQILIDVPNKMITVLDFGQAVEISNEERDFALDILRIISGVESTHSAKQLVQKHSGILENKILPLTERDLALVLKRNDRMDIFVHFLSLLDRAGFEVPLSTVHWVLAANRMIKLGEKINVPAESSFRWMLGMKKIGLLLGVYNAAASIKDKAQGLIKGFQSNKAEPLSCSKVFK